MKIYVSAPNDHRDNLKPFFNSVSNLKAQGHRIIDIYKGGKSEDSSDVDALVAKYKEFEKNLRECDVYLVDVTYPGRRVGFEIARALDERKFVIALYDKSSAQSAKRIAPLIVQKNKHVFFEGYTEETVDSIITRGLEEAKTKLDTKFILIISPEIDRYITWASEERRMHKAQIVRNAVEDTMGDDKEYSEYLKSLKIED